MSSDPAVEAAQRVHPDWPKGTTPILGEVRAAREALEPLRDLHRPFDRRTLPYPIADPYEVVCNHCLGPQRWPCATATFIYSEDELR